ncbi:MAG: DUF4286 family protein [Bacteroidetes bacterium]|nr:DUF4286 family protein [Bacteroidota bacterium]
MIVYNVTLKVDLEVHELFLRWLKEDHIPRVMETGCFTGYKVFRVMEEHQADGITYAVQYHTTDTARYFDYQNNHAPAFQKEMREVWPDKYAAFRTLLREV